MKTKNLDTLKLIFLGSGSAFTTGGNYHSNILLENQSSHMLVDCGSDARHALYEQGFSYDDINDIYISHLHTDHSGGLEWLGFSRKFNSKKAKPILHISDKLVKKLWRNVLSGGMRSISNTISTLDTYFDVRPIGKSGIFKWTNIKFQLVKTIHTMHNRKIIPSYGLFFSHNDCSIFITTDTQFYLSILKEYYQKADIIFQDCETTLEKSGVHAHYDELKSLDEEIKAKMWLYHYNPGPLPNAKKDGFQGFVMKGQVFIV